MELQFHSWVQEIIPNPTSSFQVNGENNSFMLRSHNKTHCIYKDKNTVLCCALHEANGEVEI